MIPLLLQRNEHLLNTIPGRSHFVYKLVHFRAGGAAQSGICP